MIRRWLDRRRARREVLDVVAQWNAATGRPRVAMGEYEARRLRSAWDRYVLAGGE